MMQKLNQNMLMPVLIGAGVLMLALTLLGIVIFGPYTHSNLDLRIDPHYTRTTLTMVGAPVPFEGGVFSVAPASDPAQQGKQLFVVKGCVDCHGLDGSGGIVGPSLLGKTAKKLRSVTRVGRTGMPAFADGALSDADLDAIAAFLNATIK